ncbi:head decoration protein [Bradyrhizobium sp. LTSP849]|uniref:head decoration protein n=1 Tax=Bradyrhizobium sp. LTSP849 TaxID=1615890 RepID=UPI000A483AA7|nr:head decoration protein [Bradyrhizobium sp. LTSP849]
MTAVSVSYKVWPLNFAATDGSQNALEVWLSKKTALNGGADQTIVAPRRGPSIVDSRFLIWLSGATADQIAAASEQLMANGIVPRSS